MTPPPLPEIDARNRTVVVIPHRAQKLLILAIFGFLFAPCGGLALWWARRDLRAMAAGTMDRSGEPLTRTARMIAIVSAIVWAIKWILIISIGLAVYYFFW